MVVYRVSDNRTQTLSCFSCEAPSGSTRRPATDKSAMLYKVSARVRVGPLPPGGSQVQSLDASSTRTNLVDARRNVKRK
jgi:hypothetical protein